MKIKSKVVAALAALLSAIKAKAMALAVGLLVAAVVIAIGITVIACLIRLCQRLLPPTPPPNPNQTNHTESVVGTPGVTAPGVLQFPAFQFAGPLPAPAGQTEENPLGNSWFEVERSTNLIHWETIRCITNLNETDVDIGDDTNPPPDRAFYRLKIVYP